MSKYSLHYSKSFMGTDFMHKNAAELELNDNLRIRITHFDHLRRPILKKLQYEILRHYLYNSI